MTALPAVRLRELLDKPAPKDNGWQEEAGRMVSLLVVQFQQEVDETKALTIVALIGLAAEKGVKKAKKKALKLTRWSKTQPPMLATLKHLDEQHAALRALSKIQSPWAIGFIEATLADPTTAQDLLPDLLKWASAASPTWASLVARTYAGSLANCMEVPRAIVILKEAPKLLRAPSLTPPEQIAETLGTLIRVIESLAGRFAEDKKSSMGMLQTGYQVHEQAWRDTPALLFQPVFLNVLPAMAKAIGTHKRRPPESLDSALNATILLVGDSIARFGSVAVQQYRQMVPIWLACYPNFQSQLKIAAAMAPSLNSLLSDTPEIALEIEQPYLSEAAFASLLPAWDAFVAGLPDPKQAASVSSMLEKAAGAANVDRDGVIGEVLAYNPLTHDLVDSAVQSPGKVKVLRSGVVVRRTDGSLRTLVRTLVTAA